MSDRHWQTRASHPASGFAPTRGGPTTTHNINGPQDPFRVARALGFDARANTERFHTVTPPRQREPGTEYYSNGKARHGPRQLETPAAFRKVRLAPSPFSHNR